MEKSQNVLVVTKMFSKFTQFYVCQDQKALTVAKRLVHEWFLKLGVPTRIHSDCGQSFENEFIGALCTLYSVKKTRTSPYHACGNSEAERCNRTLHNLLGALEDEKKWHLCLPELVYAYNCSPHSSTSFVPYYLLMGRKEIEPEGT